MSARLRDHSFLALGALLGALLLLGSVLFGWDLWEAGVEALESLEAFEVDEWLLPLLLLGLGWSIDLSRRHLRSQLMLQRLRTFQQVSGQHLEDDVHHLRTLLRWRRNAVNLGQLPPTALHELDQIILSTHRRISSLMKRQDIDLPHIDLALSEFASLPDEGIDSEQPASIAPADAPRRR